MSRTSSLPSVGELDAGEPEAGGLELGAGRQHGLPVPQAVEAFGVGALEHATTEGRALVVVLALELQPEQALDEPAGFAAFEPVSLRGLVDLVERRDEPAADPLHHVIGV